MRINYVIASMLAIFIVAVAGCTSPSPTPSPEATATPTATESPTPIANASPSATAIANASPTVTAIPSATATTFTAGNMSVSGISVDWDTFDTMQHDTAHLKVKNNGQYMALDVDVLYTVSTPGTIINPDNSSYTQNQTYGPVTVQLGRLNAGEAKDVTIQSPDHKKNVPAYITIKIGTREGTTTVFEGMLEVPDHAMGTKTF